MLTVQIEPSIGRDSFTTRVLLGGLGRFEPNEFFFRIEGPDAPATQTNGNFSLLAALPLAMSKGMPLHVEADVDADLLIHAEECMQAWCRWRPDLFKSVRLSAKSEKPPQLSPPGAAIMAFSGGLDSTFALHAHKHNLLGRRTARVDAAVLIHGFDVPLKEGRAFDIACRHVRAITDSYGVRLNIVRTDWKDAFCIKWGMTHVFGIASALHLFNGKFSSGIFADDTPYEHQLTPWSSNAITNQMMGCARFPVRSAGASWDRTEKAGIVASNKAVLEHLRVCYERPELGENCGTCEKCIRTKLNFYANGTNYVPALRSAVTPHEVLSKCTLNPRIRHLYFDTIEHGSWPKSDPVRIAVQELIRTYDEQAAASAGSARSKALNTMKRLRKAAMQQLQSVISLHRN